MNTTSTIDVTEKEPGTSESFKAIGVQLSPRLFGKLLPLVLLTASVFIMVFFVGGNVCFGAEASGTAIDALLPAPGFLPGWNMEGKAEIFSRENLYEHINGEAELYLPYGFETLLSAYYGLGGQTKTSIEIGIYKMGSLLDAFGIYSNYRDPEAEPLQVGVDGVISDGQALFYQDRYFVRLSTSGSGKPGRQAFIACAAAIAAKLPGPAVAPAELALFKAPGLVPRSEKFIAESLLGYKFLPKGLTAEATVAEKPVKAFVIVSDSEAAASATLGLYADYLKKEGGAPLLVAAATPAAAGATTATAVAPATPEKTLIARDPLYKGVALRQSGRYLFGIIKLEDPQKGIPLLDKWSSQLPH